MENCIITEKFTLIPSDYYKQEYLGEIFELKETEEVKSYDLPHFNAILACAFSKENTDRKEGTEPLILSMLNSLNNIKDHNKIVINFNKELKLLHIVAAEEKKLLFANSFRCTHINTALYFLTLVCQQTMLNPQITGINVYGTLENNEEKLITTYFPKINYIK